MIEPVHTDLDADLDRVGESLQRALREPEAAEKNYHVRTALQDVVVLAERLESPFASGRRGRFEPLRE